MSDVKKESIYEVLSKVDTKNIQEKKNGLTYLSWAYALDEIYKRYPEAEVEVRHWDGKPYLEDEHLGYWVEVAITIEGIKREAHLPCMDYRNKAIPVGMATFMDINKTIQRAIAKACALHGLSLNLYAGSDIPLGVEEGEADMKQRLEEKANRQMQKKVASETIDEVKKKTLLAKCKEDNVDSAKLVALYKINDISEMTMSKFKNCMDNWEQVKSACGV